jgi:hypothetical protein
MAETNTTNVPEEEPPGNTWSYLIICRGDTGPAGDPAFPMRRSPRTAKGHRDQGPAASISSLEPQVQGGVAINGDRASNLDATQRVGLMIKATVMDAPYLDMMVRHMICPGSLSICGAANRG